MRKGIMSQLQDEVLLPSNFEILQKDDLLRLLLLLLERELLPKKQKNARPQVKFMIEVERILKIEEQKKLDRMNLTLYFQREVPL